MRSGDPAQSRDAGDRRAGVVERATFTGFEATASGMPFIRRDKENRMFQNVSKIVKWVALPVLLLAAVFARYADAYEAPLNLAMFLGTIVLVERAVRLKKYYWAAGFVGAAIVFSPLLLVDKIFLSMAFTCTFTLIALLAAFRPEPAVVNPA
jgi:hypothetical protein